MIQGLWMWVGITRPSEEWARRIKPQVETTLQGFVDQAITDLLNAQFFWMREVYDKTTCKGDLNAKGKGKWNQWRKQAKNSPSEGQDPAGKPTVDCHEDRWTDKDSKNRIFCKNFLIRFSCHGGCGRSHQCPIKLTSGKACEGNHHPSKCPSL